jgi:phage-related protein
MFDCMGDPFDIEIEPEVRLWLMNLSDADFERAEHAAGRLSDDAATLGEPHSRYLGDGVRELRFDLGHDREAVRLSYWLASGRRAVLLTVFRKTKQREEAEVARAKRAKVICEAEHGPAHEEFTRTIKERNNR